MIIFYIKRYLQAISSRRMWLLVALAPALAYLLFSAIRPDRFLIYQDISIPNDAPVAIAASPVDFINVSDVLSSPSVFLMDKFALREIYMELYPGAAIEQTEQGFGNILKIIENEISLKATSQNNIRISYYGSDVKKGEKLVDFYSKRLCRKTGEGFKRHALQASDSKSSTDTAKDENKSGAVKLTGSITIKENKAILRTDRISPAIKILVLSFIVIFVFIGFLECIDPSFKSERQVSRYLGLPTLGSLPDLNKISKIE